ncbi:MAG: hypothetical protein Q6M04_07455 [Thermostichus sp. BF3_bins_97]
MNSAFGNTDFGRLEFEHVDMNRGWVTLPRSKTGKLRRCPLWPETIAAVQESIDILREEVAKGWRDPQLVESFFEFLRSCYARCGAPSRVPQLD